MRPALPDVVLAAGARSAPARGAAARRGRPYCRWCGAPPPLSGRSAMHDGCARERRLLLADFRLPGRRGALAVVRAYGQRRHPPLRPRVIADAFALRANRHGLQAVLAHAWMTGGAMGVRAAARDAATLASWFARADYRRIEAPFVRDLGDPGALPERVTLYRGGRGDPAALAAGASWSVDRSLAAMFTECAGGFAARHLPPVVVRREVGRGEVDAYVESTAREALVLDPRGPWSVECADPRTIRGWALDGLAEMRRTVGAVEARSRALLAGGDTEAFWRGWDGP